MSALQWTQYVLDNDWEPTVTGRNNPVPKPVIDIQKERSNIRLSANAHINIIDGGNETHTPNTIGATHEAVSSFTDIVIRVAEGTSEGPDDALVHFEGERDANNDAEAYGGLRGEVKRILEQYVAGDKEFELIVAAEWRDETPLVGSNWYRGAWGIQLDDRAKAIDPPIP